MLEAARLIDSYMAGVTFDQFWHQSEKRDAVALRLSVLGESAGKISQPTEAALPQIPFQAIRGLRNRIAHDYGAVDFRIVWTITQQEIKPLIAALESHLGPAAKRPKKKRKSGRKG
jgi:uncharacterized protein with HEPN domain